jgi:hypothetical protein
MCRSPHTLPSSHKCLCGRRVSFAIHPFEGKVAVDSVVEGVCFAELTAAFEGAQGCNQAVAVRGLQFT